MGPVDTILSMLEKVVAAAGLSNEWLTATGIEVIAITSFAKRWLGKGDWQTWVVAGVVTVGLSLLAWWGNWFAAGTASVIVFLISAVLLKGTSWAGNKANATMTAFDRGPSKKG